MKKYILLTPILLFSLVVYSQIIDRTPIGNENILPAEGGGIKMEVDTTTSLPNLINRLNTNWNFIETGKGYWIGYTNDMFSIANRGDEAISELVKFFKSSANDKGKIGVLYTLHLIGINRKIAGRFYEEFTNKNARKALLGLLPDKKYTYDIVSLLMRDPWKTDVPSLLEIIKNESDIEVIWPIINSLNRYKIENLPINNSIPKSVLEQTITLDVKNENILERDFDFNGQIKEALKAFSKSYSNIKVETELQNEELSPYYRTKLGSNLRLEDFLVSIGIAQFNTFGYSTIGCKLQYFYDNGILYFITISTTKQKIMNWWNALSPDEKRKFE